MLFKPPRFPLNPPGTSHEHEPRSFETRHFAAITTPEIARKPTAGRGRTPATKSVMAMTPGPRKPPICCARCLKRIARCTSFQRHVGHSLSLATLCRRITACFATTVAYRNLECGAGIFCHGSKILVLPCAEGKVTPRRHRTRRARRNDIHYPKPGLSLTQARRWARFIRGRLHALTATARGAGCGFTWMARVLPTRCALERAAQGNHLESGRGRALFWRLEDVWRWARRWCFSTGNWPGV